MGTAIEKRCNKCKKKKPFSEFHKSDTHKFGVRNTCKSCIKKANAKYYIQHAIEIKENVAKYNTEHVENKHARDQAYFNMHRDFLNLKHRNRSKKHRAELSTQYIQEYLKFSKELLKLFPDEFTESQRVYLQTARILKNKKKKLPINNLKLKKMKSSKTPETKNNATTLYNVLFDNAIAAKKAKTEFQLQKVNSVMKSMKVISATVETSVKNDKYTGLMLTTETFFGAK